ncbi:MAG TPA: hypothetical protein VMM80_04605 [Bacteroidota bacterium]|nr:hypothetical protein [Bacteroidota bacterium]
MSIKSVLCAFVFFCATTALAQDQNPPQAPKDRTPVVRERQANQKARIRQGVKSGELTKGEARKLHQEQKTIKAEKQMAKADGKVTHAERAKLRKDQNKASRDIYKLKHNNRVKGGQTDTK